MKLFNQIDLPRRTNFKFSFPCSKVIEISNTIIINLYGHILKRNTLSHTQRQIQGISNRYISGNINLNTPHKLQSAKININIHAFIGQNKFFKLLGLLGAPEFSNNIVNRQPAFTRSLKGLFLVSRSNCPIIKSVLCTVFFIPVKQPLTVFSKSRNTEHIIAAFPERKISKFLFNNSSHS